MGLQGKYSERKHRIFLGCSTRNNFGFRPKRLRSECFRDPICESLNYDDDHDAISSVDKLE